MQEKFRPFSQFHTAAEHEQFLRNLTKERALRLRIRELIKYRRNGLTRHEECTEYERLRYFRERKKEARMERQRRKSVSHYSSFTASLADIGKWQTNGNSFLFNNAASFCLLRISYIHDHNHFENKISYRSSVRFIFVYKLMIAIR